MAKKNETVGQEEQKFTALQICNQFKLTGYDRKIIDSNFSTFEGTFPEWVEKLEKIGFKIN